MSLDRDELAARNMAALLSNPSGPVQANPSSGWGLTNCTPDDVAALAVSLTDALIARLRPVAPVADAAPRPEWVPKVGERVRVTRDYANHANVKAGDEYVVTSLGTADYPETEAWGCGEGGVQYVRVANLEPCAAPAPSAAPDPRRTVGAVTRPKHDSALWVVINSDEIDCCRRLDGNDSGRLGDFFRDDLFVRWATREECERHGIAYVSRPLPGAPPVEAPAAAPDHPSEARRGQGAAGDQRVAAGLDAPAKPAPAVDREAFTTLLDAVKWVLNDAAFKAPEQMGEVAERWVARLERAIDSLPPSLTKGGAS